MTASAATVANRRDFEVPNGGLRIATFTTTLAAAGEDGVTVPLGWSDVYHVSASSTSSTGASVVDWGYSAGVLTLYGEATAGDALAVSVMVVGAD